MECERLPLAGRNIVLGVCGSIAAYKAADLTSKLVQAGAVVDIILTEAAQSFVGPMTFQGLTHRPVMTDLHDPRSELGIDHVALAKRAEVMVVAPATANTIAAVAHGFAGDALTTTALSTDAPLIVCPAMESRMYEHPATQANLALLRERGAVIVEPESGRLASGLTGVGRLADPTVIVGTVRHVLGREGDWAGRTVVVTAGGTREPMDPVRYVANRSSGKMGHAIAAAARDRGARVILVTTAPVDGETAVGVEVVSVNTALEMKAALHAALESSATEVDNAPVLIMAAAVADYRPARAADQKLKKDPASEDGLSLELTRNPDIVAGIGGDVVKIGFAAETSDLLANARNKITSKNLHMIVANDVTKAGSGFGTDTNEVTFLYADGRVEPMPLLTKEAVAHELLDKIGAFR